MKGIIGIKSWKRAGKDLLGAIIATEHTELVNKGFGNVHIYETPYPYEFMPTRKLLDRMFYAFNHGEENLLFYISEAQRFLNARTWDQLTKQDVYNLAGLDQMSKNDCTLIFNWFKGPEDNELLGTDKILRSGIDWMIDIVTRRSDIENKDIIKFTVENIEEGEKPFKVTIREVSQYFKLFDTKEKVI